jgi:hypothetical protein
MKFPRLCVGAVLASAVFSMWLGACSDDDEACGNDGVKNGVCQAGPTCSTGSVELPISSPADSCPANNGAGGAIYICCVPGPDGGVSSIDSGAPSLGDAGGGQDVVVGTGDAKVDTGNGDSGPVCAKTCTVDTDCGQSTTTCSAEACSAGCCVEVDSVEGTTCTDKGGKVCNGHGSCVSCTATTDCPAQASSCIANTCSSFTCGTSILAAGAACSDNGGTVCDGHGVCIGCLGVSDCPVPTTACVIAACTGSACATSNAALGTACTDNGGSFCDGAGACVGCNTVSDCPTPASACVTASCDAASHTCKTADALGGTVCTDAGGTVCNGMGTCVGASCMDGFKDGTESDVDCGGTCGATCTDTPPQDCKLGTDCISGVCTAGKCQVPTCSDGVKNGAETAKDCGGGTCPTCALGLGCSKGSDCTSGDCDNGFCATVVAGGACTANDQCASDVCGVSGTGNCCLAACSTAGACGATGCGAAGACTYPGSATSCAATSCTGSTLTTFTACGALGTCDGAPALSMCPNNLACSGTACATACGANDTQGDAKCALGFWCDGVAGGACDAPQATGAACTRDSQCTLTCDTVTTHLCL